MVLPTGSEAECHRLHPLLRPPRDRPDGDVDLVAARYMLEEDVELSVTLAARTWDWLA